MTGVQTCALPIYVRPLVAALAGEHFETADLLRDNGADLDARGQFRTNPLHAAAHYGNLEVARVLIEYDPTAIHARDSNESTPLHWAVRRPYFEGGPVARLLLAHRADINAQTNIGRTPLHWASSWGVLEIVRLLLEHGADVEVKNNNGETALQELEAAEGVHDEVVKLLREHGTK